MSWLAMELQKREGEITTVELFKDQVKDENIIDFYFEWEEVEFKLDEEEKTSAESKDTEVNYQMKNEDIIFNFEWENSKIQVKEQEITIIDSKETETKNQEFDSSTFKPFFENLNVPKEKASGVEFKEKKTKKEQSPQDCQLLLKPLIQGKTFSVKKIDVEVDFNLQRKKPYGCLKCRKRYKTEAFLQRHHIAMHKRQKGFKCELCKRSFIWEAQLIKHRPTHSAKKANLFSSKCALVVHQIGTEHERL